MVTTKYKVQKMFPFLVVRFWWLSFSLHVLCVLCMRVCLCLGQLINMNEMKLPKNFHTITHYAPPTYTHISHIVLPVGFQVDCKIRKRTPHAHTHINGPHSSRLCVYVWGCACQLSLHKWLSRPQWACVWVLKNEPIMAEKLQQEIRLASVGSPFSARVCFYVFNECPCSHTLLIGDSSPIDTT